MMEMVTQDHEATSITSGENEGVQVNDPNGRTEDPSECLPPAKHPHSAEQYQQVGVCAACVLCVCNRTCKTTQL